MMKYFLYISLSLLLGVFYTSCDDKNDTNYTINGKWQVIDRQFTCEADPDLQKTVVRLMRSQSESLKKGESEFLSFEDGEYNEGEMKWEKIGGGESGQPLDSFLMDKSRFTGLYTQINKDEVNVTVQNVGTTWSYQLDIADLNNEFIRTEQVMNNKDLSLFLDKYFGLRDRTVAEGVTAVWETKSAKVREE